MMKKITIKQLMNRYRFKDIAKELATVWEHNPIGTDYRDYKILYRRLRQAAGVDTGHTIHISSRWDEEWQEGRCVVIGTEDPLPSLVEWHESLAEVLGMEIIVGKNVSINEKELLAGLFHEITKMSIEEKRALEKRHYWIPWFNNPRNQWRLRRLKSTITLPYRLLYSKFLYKEEVVNYKHPRKRKRETNRQSVLMKKTNKNMKRTWMMMCMVFVALAIQAQGEKLNVLNYSGKLYVSGIDVIETPRYISFTDHALLSKTASVPMLERTTVELDFANNRIKMQGEEDTSIRVTAIKKHDDCVVIYAVPTNSKDKFEIVFPKYENPYMLQITQEEDKVSIARCNLQSEPPVINPEDAILQMLMGL